VRQQVTNTESTSATHLSPGSQAAFTPARFALLLGVLIFAAFPQILLGLQTFAVRDFGFFSYPVASYQRECFWRGELPFWNPYSHCGVPFLAQWNTMPLYPPALIYLLLPLNWSLSFFCLAHLFWAGLGMYFLARRWTGSLLAAPLAGLIFAFNGFSLNLLMWPSHIATLSWVPWVIAATERGWQNGGQSLAVAALIGALQMLAGAPETIFITWTICAALWVSEAVKSWRQNGLRVVLAPLCRFPAMVILVAGIAAAQLLPFLDLAAHSQRETGFADARWSMPASGWSNFLVPMAFGSTVKQGLFFQHGQYWTSSYYLGIGTLVLAAIGFASARNLRVWLLGSGALLAVILATGDQTFLSRAARHLLPQLSLMTYPVKFVMVAVVVLPLLAAFGLARLEQTPGLAARRRILWAAAAVAAALMLVLFLVWRFPLPGDNTPAALTNGLSRAAFLVCAAVLLWALVSIGSLKLPKLKTAPQLLPLLVLVLFWFDVWTHEPQQNPGMPLWVYQPGLARKQLALNPEPALGRSRIMISPAAEQQFRQRVLDDLKDNYLVKRLGFFADCNLLDGVPKVDGFFSLCPRECGELNSALYVSKVTCGAGLPDFLSVSHMTASVEDVKWTTRDTFLPLATGGQSPVFLDDTNALLTILSANFDPRRTVVLPLDAKPFIVATAHEPVSVATKLKKITAHQVDLEVDAAAPALVVVGQTYYHQWRALVDGKPGKLLRANYAFQAIPVPAGQHHVQLRYEDRAFQIGAVVSAIALAACLGLAVMIHFRATARCRPTHAE